MLARYDPEFSSLTRLSTSNNDVKTFNQKLIEFSTSLKEGSINCKIATASNH